MKKQLVAAAIALAGFAAFSTAQAQNTSFTYGDVILGFEDSGHLNNYLVDLGSYSTLNASISAGTFSTINLNSDLTAVFGSAWASTAGIQYGAFGILNTSPIESTVAAGASAPGQLTTGLLSTTKSHFNTLGAAYTSDFGVTGQALTYGVKQIVGTSDSGFSTWSGNTPSAVGTSAFKAYNTSIETALSNGLDFYIQTGNTAPTMVGTLTLDSSGNLSAVPEPGTYALFGLGALLLVIAVRRKSANS